MEILERLLKEPIQKLPDNPLYDTYEDEEEERDEGDLIDWAYEQYRDDLLMEQYEKEHNDRDAT